MALVSLIWLCFGWTLPGLLVLHQMFRFLSHWLLSFARSLVALETESQRRLQSAIDRQLLTADPSSGKSRPPQLLHSPEGKVLLRYQCFGKHTQPLLLFLGSWPFDTWALWSDWSRSLAEDEGFQVLVVEDLVHQDWTLIILLLDQLNLLHQKPLTAIGYGVGVPAVLNLASEYPELVARLILIHPPVLPSPSASLLFSLSGCITWPLRQLWSLSTPALRQHWIHLGLKSTTFLALFLPTLRQEVHVKARHLPRPLWLRIQRLDQSLATYQEMAIQLAKRYHQQPDYVESILNVLETFPFHQPMDSVVIRRVAKHPKKVLIVWGEENLWFPIRYLQRWLTALPHARAYTGKYNLVCCASL